MMKTITITTDLDWSKLDRVSRIRLWAKAVEKYAVENGDRDQADNCSRLWLDPLPIEWNEWRVQQMTAYAEAHGLTLRIEQPPPPPDKSKVIDVSAKYVTMLNRKGAETHLTWDELREAAYYGYPNAGTLYNLGESAQKVVERYQQLLADARKLVERKGRKLPITCSVGQNETNVWWVASFADVSGSDSWIPRPADCGGTLPTKAEAKHEMRERAEYLRRLGYTVVEEVSHG